ncbi:MAG: ribonuclease D [Micavibrio sp.]|nr:ribonuclease D [Micavibrio sp.]|tara:strand:- start:3020 stop:4189 length:1170 start_codon:yes stop_codon:yes gene_type:complete
MVITKQDELKQICKELSRHPFITIDTEFLREKTYYPKLCLIQLSDPHKNAVAVDPLADGIDLEPLFDLLSNKNVLKVFHAARQDLEIFFNMTGKVVDPFFDTQIAAMVLGYGDSVGYENLVRSVSGGTIDKSSQYTDWSNRPLSEKQVNYALGDVTHLCDVYIRLKDQLEEKGRTSWVFEEEEILAAPATYENNPRDMWKKVKIRSPKPKNLAVLREIAAWREERAQTKDIPRSWVMRDDTLADMASQAPRDLKGLSKIRNLPGEFSKGHKGERLLKLIEKGLKTPKNECPELIKKKPLSPSVMARVDILKMLLKIQSAECGVAPKLIASSDDLEVIASEDSPDAAPLKGWRAEVFGNDALAIKNGELAIGLKGSTITKFVISDFDKTS